MWPFKVLRLLSVMGLTLALVGPVSAIPSAAISSITRNAAAQALAPELIAVPPITPQLNSIEPAQPFGSQAAQAPSHTIYLKSGDLTPGAPDPVALDQLARSDDRRSGSARVHILLQLDFIPREAAKAEYDKHGVKLLAYVPDYAWIASVPASNPAGVLNLPGVTWAGPLTVNDKLDPAIVAGQWLPGNLAPDGTAAVSVVTHQDEDVAATRELVAKHDGTVTGEVIGIKMLMVEMPQQNIAALAAEEPIQWIEPAAPPLGPTNDGIRQQIGVNVVNSAPYSLTGASIDVLVYDSGQAGDHIDFGARLTHGDVDAVSEHSTHVAGTVGGSGANSVAQGGGALQWRGMAPAVDLISYGTTYSGTGPLFYQNVPDIESDFATAQNTYGADLGTASLGSNVYSNYPMSCTLMMGKYGASDVLIDQIIRGGNAVVGTGDKYVTTWAAGNERNQTGSCSDTYNSIAPPGAAKNPIHVGASNTNNNSMTTFSSWGPTQDGRIKPIVVAGGCQSTGDGGIKSTDNSPIDTYTVMCGTSMATPAVGGSIALMLQQYRATYSTSSNFWPSTAKALLMQTASDFGNPGPDYQWGFGQVHIQRAVDLIRRRGLAQDSLAQGETDMYTFVVTDTAEPAQVSLAWDDYQATFNANPTLINNLNLVLVDPSGAVWRPWVLNPASPAITATTGIDNRNNQEQVTVPSPEKGTWLVRVAGTTVPQGPQDYSLACEGCRLVNAGACQAIVDNAPLLADARLLPAAEGADFVPLPAPQGPPAAPPSAGEQWQRDLEEGRAGAPAAAVAVNDQEGDLTHPIHLTRPTNPDRARVDRIAAALREFDAARNAGPEAVIAFADRSDFEVRAVIEPAVMEAREEIAARANPVALSFPTVPAAPHAPRVGVNGGCAYNTVQEGITAATNGQTVRVVGDFFAENIDISGGKVITIEGGYDATCTSVITGTLSRLDGVVAGSVVDVSGGSAVTLINLKLGWGSSFGAGLDVLGSSQVILENTDIVHNNSGLSDGGGIYVGGSSQVTLTNGSLMQHNTSSAGGGAIVHGRLNVLDANSVIANNCSTSDGGGVYVNGGTLYLDEADLTGNQAAGAAGRGGAIFAAGGTVTLTNAVFLGNVGAFANTAYDGGGIYADNALVNLSSSTTTLSNNAAANNGGGVYLTNGSRLLINNSRIGSDFTSATGNDADLGAGIYAISSTISGSVRLYNNVAASFGGGLYASASIITLTNAAIGDTGANRPNRLTNDSSAYGAGLFLTDGTQGTLSNTAIISNTFPMTSTGLARAGGAYVEAGSVLTLTNSRLERHVTPPGSTGRGAALYVVDARVVLNNSQIVTNTATTNGGGIRLFGASALEMHNSSILQNNRALNGEGGGIASSGVLTMTLSDATLHDNAAGTDGGAIYLNDSTLNATGWWDFRFNSAGSDGGAVAVTGSGDADFTAGGDRISFLAVNAAGGHGGALYVTSAETVQLHATGVQQLNLNTNNAGGHGGAVYADDGAFFDIQGRLQATSNIAGGDGGVFFLGGGSTLWVADSFNARPQIWVNQADDGGAIYASGSPRVECDGADFGSGLNGNRATSGSGGALYVITSTFTADNCTFRNNQAEAGDGGAIAAYTSTVSIDTDYPAASLGSLARLEQSNPPLASVCDPLAARCSQFSSNRAISSTASNGNGGAIFNSGSALSLNNTYLHRNQAVRGGAIYQVNAAARSWLSNTLIYSNTSLGAFGAGIRNAGGAMTLTHVTAANNTGGAGFSPGSAQSYVYNTIIWGNSVAAFGALTATSCNIDQGGTAGPATEPLFLGAGAGENYHLSLNSPAVDACDTGLPRDLDNRARPLGDKYDMGAYELYLQRVSLPIVLRN
jgi:hypothetical protein